MIQETVFLETTPDSHPFCSAVFRCALADHGYREEEYLLRGTANLYETGADGRPQVRFADRPYTGRMIVRRPDVPERCNGAVVVEIINSTANFDIERIWADSWRYFVRHGMIYVGVTSKPNVFPGLKRFDAQRYGRLDWPNPAGCAGDEAEVPKDGILLGPPDQEMGYIWDILLELPAFLKSGSPWNPLADCPVRDLYLAGWSQSCSYINRLLNSFVYFDKRPVPAVYDGYFAAGGVHAVSTPVNRHENGRPSDALSRRVDYCPAPLMELNTESENSDEDGFGGYSARRADSDRPEFRYRYLEITGSCHDSADSARDYTRFDGDAAAALGFGLHSFDAVPSPNTYPKHFGFHLAWRNLLLWAREGVNPVSVPRIRQDAAGRNRKDAFGNSVGGLRTPLLDLPTARYYSWSETAGRRNAMMGHEEGFSAAWLRETYHSLDRYRSLAEASTLECVSEGMLLPEDAAEMTALAVARAKQGGLT